MQSLVGQLIHYPRRSFIHGVTVSSLINKTFFRKMSQSNTSKRVCRVAVTQMTSVSNKEENLSICEDLVKKAAAAGAQMVFLPEACDYIAESKEDSINMAESIHGPLVSKYCELAVSLGVWLSIGGLHIKEKEDSKVSNTHIVINDKGEISSSYKKAHLFSVHIPEKNLYLEESAYISEGEAIHPPVVTPVGKVALAICYDMRFPELSLIQRKLGAEILTYPSAFTVTTGLAHWEIILRGRAIETQCYVIAAAQTGQHNKKRSSYGHAMIVDPWGTVLSEIKEGTDFAVADIDLDYLEKVRRDMPVLAHRRCDLYRLLEVPTSEALRLCEVLPSPSSHVSYQFGNVSVPGSCIFLKSVHSQAFVNKKPVVPGHVLLTPERPAKRLNDLNPAELCDLIQLTQIALEIIIKEYEAESVQIAIQDGPAAGQTVEHVHIHVVPLNAASRQKLQGHEKHNEWRDVSEMEKEACSLHQAVKANTSALLKRPSVIFQPFNLQKPTLQEEINSDHPNIPDEFLIAKTRFTCAFVAPDPVLDGHVCVSPIQPCLGLREGSVEVLTDVFFTVQLVQKFVEDTCKTDSSTVIILQDLLKDKPIQQLQVHIIPRSEGDFGENDDIYSKVKNFDWQSLKWSDSKNASSTATQIRNAIYTHGPK